MVEVSDLKKIMQTLNFSKIWHKKSKNVFCII